MLSRKSAYILIKFLESPPLQGRRRRISNSRTHFTEVQGETRDSNYILTTGRTHTYVYVGKCSTVLPPKKKTNRFFKNSGQN